MGVVVQNNYMDNFNTNIYSRPINNDRMDKVKKFLTVPKIIFLVLGIIILVEIIYAIRIFVSPSPAPVSLLSTTQSENKKTGGNILLSASQTSIKVNETVPVSVTLDTGGHEISGTDVIIRYDPKIIETTSEGLIKGKIFNEYPVASVDNKKGEIVISAFTNIGKGFEGTGQLVSFNLKAKTAGKAILSIDFGNLPSTTDSNLMEASTSKDILESVNNLELNIQ